jgi:hypothetical protein
MLIDPRTSTDQTSSQLIRKASDIHVDHIMTMTASPTPAKMALIAPDLTTVNDTTMGMTILPTTVQKDRPNLKGGQECWIDFSLEGFPAKQMKPRASIVKPILTQFIPWINKIMEQIMALVGVRLPTTKVCLWVLNIITPS